MTAVPQSPYYPDYPGQLGMRWHDGYEPLERWFHNWKIEKYAMLPYSYEWLTIEETFRLHRGRRIVIYTGTIGADHHPRRRTVLFEPNAPPPPSFLVPVRKKFEPPPPERPGWGDRRMRDLAHFDRMMSLHLWASLSAPQRFVAEVLPPVPPPPPQWRRN